MNERRRDHIANFDTDIALICPPSASTALTTALNTNPLLTSLPLPRPYVVAPKDLELTTGTAEILRFAEVRDLIQNDFLVLPCDLVCELGGDKLLQAWMVKAASLTEMLGATGFANGPLPRPSGGLGVWFDTKSNIAVKNEETDFVATTSLPPDVVNEAKGSLFSSLSQLVYAMPTDSLNDLIEEKKGLPIRHRLLKE